MSVPGRITTPSPAAGSNSRGSGISPLSRHSDVPDSEIRLLSEVDGYEDGTLPSSAETLASNNGTTASSLNQPRTFKRNPEPAAPQTLYQFWNSFIARNFPNHIPSLTEIRTFWSQHVLNSPFKWLWFAMGISAVLFLLLIIFGSQVFPFFVRMANSIRELGNLGMFLMGLLIAVSSIPPMIGYGTLNYVSGFIFGLWGFIPSYVGGVSGATMTWLLTRIVLGNDYSETVKKAYPQWGVMERALQKRGLRLLILIRLAPYPYSIMNVLLSTMKSIPLWKFVLATAAALPKLFIHVYLGSTVHDLAELHETTPGKFAMLIIFGTMGLALFLYLGYVVGREMNQHGAEEPVDGVRDDEGDSIVDIHDLVGDPDRRMDNSSVAAAKDERPPVFLIFDENNDAQQQDKGIWGASRV